MKKPHLVLLIVTVVMAVFSAYSLAAINQVYRINFEWFSQYYGRFSTEFRETSEDKWVSANHPRSMKLDVVGDRTQLHTLYGKKNAANSQVYSTDFSKYILLYCSLGEAHTPEYRIKVTDIAQRGNVVEVKVSINNPHVRESSENSTVKEKSYFPEDVVRINRSSFPLKGRLYFIFKNQAGAQLDEKYCVMDE